MISLKSKQPYDEHMCVKKNYYSKLFGYFCYDKKE